MRRSMLCLFGPFSFPSSLLCFFLSSVATDWENTGVVGTSRRRKLRSAPWLELRSVYSRSFWRSRLGWQPHGLTLGGKCCLTRRTRLARLTCVQVCFLNVARKFAACCGTTSVLV